MGGITSAIAEGGVEAQRELLEVPLSPLLLNFQLHLPKTTHQPGREGQQVPGAQVLTPSRTY